MKEFGIMKHFWEDDYRLMKKYEGTCSDLDVSLGSLAEKGYYERVGEYKKAFILHFLMEEDLLS